MSDQLQRQLEDFDRRFGEIEDDYDDFDHELAEIAHMSRPKFDELLELRAMTPYGKLFGELRELVLGHFIPALERGPAHDREALVSMLAKYLGVRGALWDLLDEYTWRLQKAPAAEKQSVLRTILRLALLSGDKLDDIQTEQLLTSAWRDAEVAGVDPAPHFKEAATVAGTYKLASGRSPREVLEDFKPRAYGTASK